MSTKVSLIAYLCAIVYLSVISGRHIQIEVVVTHPLVVAPRSPASLLQDTSKFSTPLNNSFAEFYRGQSDCCRGQSSRAAPSNSSISNCATGPADLTLNRHH